MNRLLIVDDQRDVRDEIERMLLDMNLGFDKILHADCAQEAIKQIKKHEPTIIMLDIVMPGDNGFLVAEYIHNRRLPCDVMIMTAFPQFDFVLKAVECRIAAFLIKPIQREKLQLEMLNLLKENQYEQQKQLSLRQHSHLYFKMLDTYLSSETSDTSFDVISANTGLDNLIGDCMSVLVTRVQPTSPVHEKFSALSQALTGLSLHNIYYVQADHTCVFIIGSASAVNATERNAVADLIAGQFTSFYAGMSIQPRIVSLKRIYQQAVFALEYASSLLVDHSIVLYNAINITKALLQKHRDSIYASFIQGKATGLENALGALFIDLDRNQVSTRSVYDQWQQTFKDTRLAQMQMPAADLSLNQLRANLVSQIKSTMTATSDVPQRVGQIVQYVRDHYARHLNLTLVANELNINYSYASTVFKKFTGSSFTDYLTRYRLAKAAELLENTNCYIYEVAGKVGFAEDNKNFYRLFKQTYGLTPSQYRETRCEDNDACD